jgi:hypothetical protein
MNYFHILRKRLRTLGVSSKDARRISLDFDKQVKAMGITRALSYFKDTGDTLIGYISGSGYKAPWIKTHDGYPHHWMVLKPYPMDVQLRVAKMARVLLLAEPTPEQVSKLKDAATLPYKGEEVGLTILSNLQKTGVEWHKPYIGVFRNSFGTVCKASRTYVSRSVPTGTKVEFDLDAVVKTYRNFKDVIHAIPNWWDAIYPVCPSWMNSDKCNVIGSSPYVGELGGVMEQGGKLRIFAAPNVLLQNLMEPLQKWLDQIRDLIPSDVYRNQESGALWAQEKMRLGYEVQSIDLSSATCRYPMQVQLELLELLGCPREHINLFKRVSRGTWKVQPKMVPYFGTELQWTVGQPLGINPSMSSFALSHNLILTGLCVELGIDPLDSFRVLGDDVVCSNKELAELYRWVIGLCGISISEHKSYNSTTYAEFAGYSILPDLMVRPGRWRAASVLNIQGLVKDLGGNVIDELHEEHRLTERLLAFRTGNFTPSETEWPLYLFLNSTVFNFDPNQVELKHTESEWYDGCTKYLRKRFRGIYFQPPTQRDLYESVLNALPNKVKYDPDFRDRVDLLMGPFDADIWSPGFLMISFEAIIQMNYDVETLRQCVEVLTEEYEAFLWRIPKTDTHIARKHRDAIHKVVKSFALTP